MLCFLCKLFFNPDKFYFFNSLVIKKETEENSLDVGTLPLGIYKYRITTLNKLKQAGRDTGWLTLTIEPPREPFKIFFHIGIGWEYNILLPEWSTTLYNSYKGLNIYVSFPFSQIEKIKNTPFISSCGIEIQSSLVLYSFDERLDRLDLNNRFYSIYGFHAGLNYTGSLDSIHRDLKLIFNIDPGLSYSRYGYVFDKYSYGNIDKTYSSLDFSLLTGVTVRYFWTDMFFTDISTQYNRIFYISHPFNDIKLILRFGAFL